MKARKLRAQNHSLFEINEDKEHKANPAFTEEVVFRRCLLRATTLFYLLLTTSNRLSLPLSIFRESPFYSNPMKLSRKMMLTGCLSRPKIRHFSKKNISHHLKLERFPLHQYSAAAVPPAAAAPYPEPRKFWSVLTHPFRFLQS